MHITITATGFSLDGPLVAGEKVSVSVSGITFAEDSTPTLALLARFPDALLASVELAEDAETPGTWTGELDTATKQTALFFATARADERRDAVLELVDPAGRRSVARLTVPFANSALCPSPFGAKDASPVFVATPGPQGKAATVEVGTTTTLPPGSDATVENVGTDTKAIFNFGIPSAAGGIQTVNGFSPDEQGDLTLPPLKFATFSTSAGIRDGAINFFRVSSGSHLRQVAVLSFDSSVPFSEGGAPFAVLVVDNTARDSLPADIVFVDGETEFRPSASSSVAFDETGAIPVPAGTCKTVLLTKTGDDFVQDVFVLGVF